MDHNLYHPAWMQNASCREIGGDVFFPEMNDLTWVQARAICRGCPTLADCTDWIMATELGVDYKHRFGITAGMSPLERCRFEPAWLAEQAGAA